MTQYNPKIHHRRSIRLKGYDYSQAGLYFITICCQNRRYRFGNVVNGEMYLNDFGQIAYNEWAALEQRFPNFSLDVFQIMPNHMHGIIFLTRTMARTDGADIPHQPEQEILAVSPHDEKEAAVKTDPTEVTSTNRITIGDIVGAYKSIVNNKCLNLYKAQNKQMGKLWQRNYYEIIIRNERAYRNISQYILNNPQKWDVDKFYKQ
ncbi:MAG: hypothetical protein EOO07_31060 [Chitinophagaceae bacterium]|nr:MAG: hypothetical protein EOO07_31060 [Chitinophagaceae bacterium]